MYRTAEAVSNVVVVALGGKVVGIHRRTGKELWRNPLPSGGYGVVELHVDETTVLALVGGNLYCLELETGDERWSTAVEGSGRGTMLVAGDRVFTVCGGELTCVLLEDGARRWATGLPDMGGGSAAIGVPGLMRQADDVGSS
jgi:outer membrane protein assembly factor BamB